ncbi:MAG: site-specific DNA-methyltransferase, partial [bacterium]
MDGEDMVRHDKWLCMMWPRLVLLRELMSEKGSIWITLDDNEVHRAREMLDEIFGGNSHVGTLIWQKKYSTKSDTRFFSESHDYVLVYAKNIEQVHIGGLKRTESQDAAYKNPDNDVRGPWASDNLLRSEARGYAIYAVRGPTGQDYYPPPGTSWRYNEDKMRELISDKRVWFGADGTARPRLKRFLSEVQQAVPAQTIWGYGDVNHSDGAKKNLTEMFGGKEPPFATPKPVELLDRVISIGTEWDSIVLDSFAGSGTTAHAVLKANSKDNGQRKFILVEGEDYADRLTAERVRRAIKGYAWVGTQRETLLEEKITYTQFKKAPEWLAKVEAIKAREGFAEGDLVDQGTTKKKRFDKINVELKDGVLRVEGEKRVSQMADGLGGEFAYCTLGEPLDVEKLLSGASLPAYDALGAWLFHTATGGTLLPAPKAAPRWYLGEAKDAHVWLVYEPHLNFLKSPEAALTLSRAKEFAAWGHARNNGQGDGKRHLVFAPAKYLSNKQ